MIITHKIWKKFNTTPHWNHQIFIERRPCIYTSTVDMICMCIKVIFLPVKYLITSGNYLNNSWGGKQLFLIFSLFLDSLSNIEFFFNLGNFWLACRVLEDNRVDVGKFRKSWKFCWFLMKILNALLKRFSFGFSPS